MLGTTSMSGRDRRESVGGLGRLFDEGTAAGLSDGALIARYAGRGDDVAFAAIVGRHGPMVRAVCRRQLGDTAEADDAFQATFLVLVRKAGNIRDGDRLGPWLHGVARRVAARARAGRSRRRDVERAASRERPEGVVSAEPTFDVRPLLDVEIGRLPVPHRAAVVLCDLEGRTHDEAAEALRWPVGTVKSRLAWARKTLRGRLIRRGVAPSAALAGLGLDGRPASAALPSPVVDEATRLAAGYAAGGATPAAPAALARGVLGTMRIQALGRALAASLTLGAIAAGLLPARDRPAAVAPRPLPDRAAIRDALKDWWEGLESLSFVEDEFEVGPDGRADRGAPHVVLGYAQAPGRKRAVVHSSTRADGSTSLIQERRADGTREFLILGRDDRPGIRSVTVRLQEDDRDHYRGEMTDLLWLLLPSGDRGEGGRPLFAQLDAGAGLEIRADAEGNPQAVLTIVRGERPVRYELDPDHGWLPRRLTGAIDLTVTRFRKVGGLWFPVEGRQHDEAPRPRTTEFVVKDLRVGQPVPPSRFAMPRVGAEVQVIDLTPRDTPSPR